MEKEEQKIVSDLLKKVEQGEIQDECRRFSIINGSALIHHESSFDSDDDQDYHDPEMELDLNAVEESIQKQKLEIRRSLKRHSHPTDNLLEHNQRKYLPAPKPDVKVSIFKILKDAIGKDISKFCVPVYMNEPLSML